MVVIDQHSSREDVLRAVRTNGLSLLNAHPALQKDRALILKAAKNNACIINRLNIDTELAILVYALVNLRQTIHPTHHPCVKKHYKIASLLKDKIQYIGRILDITAQLFTDRSVSDETLLYVLLSTELLLYRPHSKETIHDFMCCANDIKRPPKWPVVGNLRTSLGGVLLGTGITAALVTTSLLPLASITVITAIGLCSKGSTGKFSNRGAIQSYDPFGLPIKNTRTLGFYRIQHHASDHIGERTS